MTCVRYKQVSKGALFIVNNEPIRAINEDEAYVGAKKEFNDITGNPIIFSGPIDCPDVEADSMAFTSDLGIRHNVLLVEGNGQTLLW